MKKMTIIDLLNKMANDEKIPERIKYNNYQYRYHDKKYGYCRSGYDCTYICLNTDYCLFNILNDEVEILEEEKKIPEKLDYKYINSYGNISRHKKSEEPIINKINEILDYLKSKGE